MDLPEYRGPRFTVRCGRFAASFNQYGWALRTRWHGWARGFPASDVIDYLRGAGWPATAARQLVYSKMRELRQRFAWPRGTRQTSSGALCGAHRAGRDARIEHAAAGERANNKARQRAKPGSGGAFGNCALSSCPALDTRRPDFITSGDVVSDAGWATGFGPKLSPQETKPDASAGFNPAQNSFGESTYGQRLRFRSRRFRS